MTPHHALILLALVAPFALACVVVAIKAWLLDCEAEALRMYGREGEPHAE